MFTLFAACASGSAAAQESSAGTVIDWSAARQFWSFQPPTRQFQPYVEHRSWPTQPVDWFVLERIEQKQQSPAPAADRATVLRRVTFDLTGLPPTPAELHDFLSDARTDAYERLVERLLASPRFGERMASMWLPLARYAEDQAHQVGDDTKFFYPNAYKYREWVINSFNEDLPYNEFLSLQLAADKRSEVRPQDLAALGFLGLGPKYYNRNRVDVMADEWEDRVDTVTRTMLGLTVACARCHDHKYDPITMQDYYALAGVFASTKMVNRAPDGSSEKADAKADKFDPNTLHVVEDGDVHDLNVFLRGNVEQKGPVVERRFLQLLHDGGSPLFYQGSGRADLAEAIVDPSNPLTSRVFVNRIWSWIFGRPLVATPSNFGHSGQEPTHPELLDDLAARFVASGWSVKGLVRELVLSSTYRQSSDVSDVSAAADPANELFARMNRRRLSVEQWRDALLFINGQLESGGGQSLDLSDAANRRRTVYARISRLKLNDLLMQFDYPDANVHAEKRSTTTTPTQKLFLLNDPFILAEAQLLAERITADPGASVQTRVIATYELLLCRPPSLDELRVSIDYLRKPNGTGASRWEQYVQMLLVSNAMLFVD